MNWSLGTTPWGGARKLFFLMLDEANGIYFSNYKDLMQNSRSYRGNRPYSRVSAHATTMQDV